VAQSRHHYERAFENYLRACRLPYIAVSEARKALLPETARGRDRLPRLGPWTDAPPSLKSFDFVVYAPAPGGNLLIDIKGRRIANSTRNGSPLAAGRLECWVTQEDVDSLTRWESLFGEGFAGAFVFVYWCDAQPPDALFQEVFEERGRWYAVRSIRVRDYAACMKTRSARWGTVDLPRADFERLSVPFVSATAPTL